MAVKCITYVSCHEFISTFLREMTIFFSALWSFIFLIHFSKNFFPEKVKHDHYFAEYSVDYF